MEDFKIPIRQAQSVRVQKGSVRGHYRMSGTGASPGSVCPCTDSWVLRAFGSDSWVWRALGSVPLALSLAASGGVFFAGGPSDPRHCWRWTLDRSRPGKGTDRTRGRTGPGLCVHG